MLVFCRRMVRFADVRPHVVKSSQEHGACGTIRRRVPAQRRIQPDSGPHGTIRRCVAAQRRIQPETGSRWHDSPLCSRTASNPAANKPRTAQFNAVRPHIVKSNQERDPGGSIRRRAVAHRQIQPETGSRWRDSPPCGRTAANPARPPFLHRGAMGESARSWGPRANKGSDMSGWATHHAKTGAGSMRHFPLKNFGETQKASLWAGVLRYHVSTCVMGAQEFEQLAGGEQPAAGERPPACEERI